MRVNALSPSSAYDADLSVTEVWACLEVQALTCHSAQGRPGGNLGYRPSPSTLFQTGLSGPTTSSSASHLVQEHGVIDTHYPVRLYTGSENSNSGSQALPATGLH